MIQEFPSNIKNSFLLFNKNMLNFYSDFPREIIVFLWVCLLNMENWITQNEKVSFFFLFFNKIWQTSSFEYHLIQAVYHRFKMFKIIEKILNRNKILIRISLRKDACLSSFKSRSKLVDSSEYSNEWKKIFINIFYIPDIVIFPI